MDGSYLCFFPNSLIYYIVILDDLLLDCVCQVLHARILLLEVDVAKTAVEQHFARV